MSLAPWRDCIDFIYLVKSVEQESISVIRLHQTTDNAELRVDVLRMLDADASYFRSWSIARISPKQTDLLPKTKCVLALARKGE